VAYERKDAFYRAAKVKGYRSRAAFKLIELNRAHRLLRRGDRVLDLGAWPGGWSQVAADVVGPQGRVVAVDTARIEPFPQPWAVSVFGDIKDENVRVAIATALGGLADVIVSDLAPKLSGVRARDEVAAAVLARVALQVAERFLRPGGRMVVKVFGGQESSDLLGEIKRRFESARLTRPDATRKGSSELYIVAIGFRPPAS
jgi:23S rRNA (uridine2552-2'-O)-methyltransferase